MSSPSLLRNPENNREPGGFLDSVKFRHNGRFENPVLADQFVPEREFPARFAVFQPSLNGVGVGAAFEDRNADGEALEHFHGLARFVVLFVDEFDRVAARLQVGLAAETLVAGGLERQRHLQDLGAGGHALHGGDVGQVLFEEDAEIRL